MKHLRTLCLFLMIQSPLLAFDTTEKIYIDSKEMDMSQDRFKIHVGGNKWIETSSVSRDERGLYTLETNIVRSLTGLNATYRNEWKCPYCFNWWPMGKSCKNAQCPSKFTEALRVKN